MQIPLLDLKEQYLSMKDEINDAILKVVESQYFILGPEVKKLEESFQKFLGVKKALGVSSGTDALLLSLMALGVGPGDEVIVPTYSFFATAGVAARLNAKLVFAEMDPVTFNIKVDAIEKLVTEKTKVIIPVHLYGQSCDMDPIMKIAKKYNIKVVEDGAQAISAQYKDGRYVGTIGDIGCFSFFPSKNLGCFGDGGLVITNDDELAERLTIMRVHGGKPKYYHKVIGGNFRLDAIQAAVLSVKLPHLNGWSEGRRHNASIYTDLFIKAGLAEEAGKIEFDAKNKVLLPKAVYKSDNVPNYHIFNQYCIRVKERDELRKYLSENGVATEIYYPVPFHVQECFSNLGYKKGDFPLAEQAADTSIAMPIYAELKKEQLAYIVDKIKEFYSTRK